MRVARVRASHFASFDRLEYGLPESGVVVVTGANGCGKSTALVESVAAAVWGETVRGSPYWTPNAETRVAAQVGDLFVSRTVSPSGKKSMEWATLGDGAEWGTPSKAQADLSLRVPEFDVWRRCAVFSSADAALFSLATDAERKRLLEQLLGVDLFDTALDRCRADARLAAMGSASFRSALDRISARLEERRARAALTIPDVPDATDSYFAARRYAREQGEARAARDRLDAALSSAREECARLQSDLASAQRRRAALAGSTCPTCTQEISDDLIDRLARAESDLLAALESAKKRQSVSEAGIRVAIERVRDASDAVSRRSATARAALQAERVLGHAAATAMAKRAEWDSGLSDLEAEEATARLALAEADARVALLEVVDRVLGTRGVRARVFGGALAGLEGLANAKVERIFPGASLQIRPTSTRKSGKVEDAISFDLQGAGGGWGYKAASQGQRRRVDLAVLLALAEMSSAARATEQEGTLYFDEAFDALDSDGVADVSTLLEEMSARRCVVVISHNADLVESLRPSAALRLHVEGGGIKEATGARPQRRQRESTPDERRTDRP